MLNRLSRVLRIDPTFYREVAERPQYLTEAALIAIVAGVIGAAGYYFNNPQGLIAFALQAANSVLVGWVLWALITNLVGVNSYHGKTNFNEMLRVLGYACAPRVLGVLAFIPCAGVGFTFLAWLLSIVAGAYAVREAMAFDRNKMNRATTTAFIGIIPYIAATVIISSIYSTGGLLFPR